MQIPIHCALASILVLAAAASAATAAEEGAGERVQSVERTGDGRPVCGLGAEFHAGRRAELRERLDGGLFVLRGLPMRRDYAPFSQAKVFWYLTGVESPCASVVIDARSGREVLLLPRADARWETWNGERWDVGDPWVPELSGFEDVRPASELVPLVRELLDGRGEVWTSLVPHVSMAESRDQATAHARARERDPLDGRPTRVKAFAARLGEELGVEVRDATPILDRMRWVKTPEELAALRLAARAGAAAIAEGIRSTYPGVGEWELDALMSLVQVREGAAGPAYHAIVGSGPNSCALHYLDSARRTRPGEVVLVDYGPELDHYTTDITRTWPVDGTFTERAAELYDAVLEAQLAGIAAVRPGATVREVDAACSKVLRARGFGHLIRHGACHFVGLEVHDPGDPGAPLVPGVVFTVEPGLYDEEAAIGIRIEDVVVVTEDGCEVITAGVPKERAAVEALWREEGLLDVLARRSESGDEE